MLYFCYFIWTVSKFENAEHIEFPQRNPESVEPNWKTHRVFPFQNATPEELGWPASPQIARERNCSLNGFPSHSTGGVNGNQDVSWRMAKVGPNTVRSLRCPKLLLKEKLHGWSVCVLTLERQLLASRAVQTERDGHLAQLTNELALKSTLLEQAEANAAQATKRAGLEPREQGDRLTRTDITGGAERV